MTNVKVTSEYVMTVTKQLYIYDMVSDSLSIFPISWKNQDYSFSINPSTTDAVML